MHWLHLQKQFKSSIENFDTGLLPERISFFSMSSLSPGYLELIAEVSKHTDIHIYIINPCENLYWGDISSEKARAKQSLEKQEYIDIGNPLLASMGIQGRDFIDQLLNISSNSNNHEPFTGEFITSDKTLLGLIQKDIYNLEEPEVSKESKHLAQNGIKGGGCSFLDDKSIVFNACHTPMREVEVLHDQILDALDSDSSLTPSDILVMMPDVEHYAPYIESIFSSNIYPKQNSWNKSLPFSIADRDPLNVHQLIEVLLKVFQLPDSQFDVESVFEILDYESVHDSFGLSIDQVDQCRELAKATNIRWGIDAKTRAKNDFPKTNEHTWKYALDNSLLGYALGEADCDSLFEAPVASPVTGEDQLGLLAYNEIEGSNALVLSYLKQFTDVVFRVNDWQSKKYTVENWLKKISQFIYRLFSIDDYASDLAKLLKIIDDLKELAELTQFKNEISFQLFHTLFKNKLQSIEGHEKFLGHGITFCALVPMRSVPFKVIALMGMNDGEYPRQDKHNSFDAVAKSPRRGDRSRRDEDRYLFLESLLAARSRLIISYTGQSVKDNSELPPSVLVSELLDVIGIYTESKPENLICKHPLQAFSPKYFQDNISNDISNNIPNNNSLFSYAAQYTALNNQRNKSIGKSTDNKFISKPLEELDERFRTITIDDLIKFYQSPARFFLKTRFDIKTYDDSIILPTREPFEIERFKNREIRELILNSSCMNDSEQVTLSSKEIQQITRAKGLLPYGDIGNSLYDQEKELTQQFIENFPANEELNSQSVTLELSTSSGDFTLQGSINSINTENNRIVQQMGAVNFVAALSLWIPHLVLNAQGEKNASQTELQSPEECFTLREVNNAKEQLNTLIENYWKGLHFPLPFFPNSAYAMFKKTKKESLSNAASAWMGSDYSSGEREKFENWLLHRDVIISSKAVEPDTLDPDTSHSSQEFTQMSREVFGEYFLHKN